MKRNFFLLSMLLAFKTIYSQVGIGTTTPRGALDINKPTTNEFGFVLPTNTSTTKIINPQGGNIAVGTMMYDSTEDCVKVHKSTGWSNCLSDNNNIAGKIDNLECNGSLTGTYNQGTLSNGMKVINYTNGNGKAYDAINVASTGVTGLTATAPAGTLNNGNGSITLNIFGTPTTSGTATFIINFLGKTCTFTVKVEQQIRTIKILSLVPDAWSTNLSNDPYTSVARSKLNNSSHFGPSGTVKISGFTYSTFDVSTGTAQGLQTAIDNADIIWISYITNGNINAEMRNALEQKINEKKKFFFIGNDNYNGSVFPGKSVFSGQTFDYFNYGNYSGSIVSTTMGPDKGAFGTLPAGTQINMTLAVGKMTNYTSNSTPFMKNMDGTVNSIIADNLIVVSDINWYINYQSDDGFYQGSSSCSDNSKSILFCNIFDKAIKYVLSH